MNCKLKLIILDIDGVLTDGTKTYDSNANVISKRYNDKDFTAIKRFMALNINVCFLSGDTNINEKMAKKRNIKFYSGRLSNGIIDKKEVLKTILKNYSVSSENSLYIGDDIFDIEIMKEVKFAYCPKDSPKCVKKICKVLNKNGGEGVIAELFDNLVKCGILSIPSVKDVMEIDSKESYSYKKIPVTHL